ncbi:hypothetical protein [Candidatus Nitrosotenuis uzonensis]|nr:hypothetical protein [Candidatus Nitrosotenuis uzonensis]
MSNLNIRITPKIKKQMDKLEINWEEYIQKMIEQKIVEEKRRYAAQTMDAIKKDQTWGLMPSSLCKTGSLRLKRLYLMQALQ